MTGPARAYLEEASQRGLALTINGSTVVAGPSSDPASLSPAVLIEYADPRIWESPVLVGELVDAVTRRVPEASAVLARTPASVDLDGWIPLVTYLRWVEPVNTGGAADDLTVTRVDGDPAVARWLSCALRAATPDLAEASIAAQVTTVVDDPRLVPLGVRHLGRLVGLASLIVTERDPVTGLEFIDLLDIWVDDPDRRRPITSALLDEVARRAGNLSKPVVGNVSHRRDDLAQAESVLAALIARGWEPWYTISRLALDAA